MQYYSPAGQDFAGGHGEAVLQGGHIVLQSEDSALKTGIGEKLHLGHTHEDNKHESSTLEPLTHYVR